MLNWHKLFTVVGDCWTERAG